MEYDSRYSIGLTIEDITFDGPANNYSFTLMDSIYELYPRGSFLFSDASGIYSEFLTLVNGTKVAFTYGTVDTQITNTFNVLKESIPSQKLQANISGNIETNLIHNYYINQQKRSKAYTGEISNIIKSLASSYDFTSTDLEETQSSGTWYQPFVNDAEFMSTFLLPFAYSTNASLSPFYLYIDANNSLNFKSLKTLFDQNSTELVLRSGASKNALAQGEILSIVPYQTGLDPLRKLQKRKLVNFAKDGTFNSNEDTFAQYPSYIVGDISNPVIPMHLETDLLSSYYSLLEEDIVSDSTKNKNLGLKVSSMRDMFLFDKVIITTNLNPSLYAGSKVSVTIPLGTNTKEDLSSRFTGDYIVERSYHKWNGKNGASILVCGRGNIQIPKDYRNRSLVVRKE